MDKSVIEMNLHKIIYGGSFDPPHKGHALLLQSIMKQYPSSQLVVMMSAKTPKKETSSVLSAHRLGMLELFIKQVTEKYKIKADRILCEYYEMQQKGISYTIHTSRWCMKKYKNENIAFLIGDDLLENLQEWKSIGQIFAHHPFLVYPRNNKFLKNQKLIQIIQEKYQEAQIHLLSAPIFACNSSEIRKKLSALQAPRQENLWNRLIRKFQTKKLLLYLDKAILSYILENRLYHARTL